MLNLDQIKQQYPEKMHSFSGFLLREYLQYKILDIISHSVLAPKLSFIGGTALRIIYNNQRFSEDLDFDNFDLTEDEFVILSKEVKDGLIKDGARVDIRLSGKEAFRCYIQFPGLLFEEGLSSMPDQKILLQIDTLAQGVVYEPETQLLSKFDVITDIRVTPVDILLAQKLYTCVNRSRAKGRDFYDIVFLLEQNTKPNYKYLKQKIDINHVEDLRAYIMEKTEPYNFSELADDVKRFLFDDNSIQKVTRFRDIFARASL